jgi:hypothetical protein
MSNPMESPDHPFNGIFEKLKRADENIVNLKSEIDAFIHGGKYPVIPHPDDKMWEEAVDYHRSKPIPKRFSVLAGEIVHHLRSSLDHIIWHFSSDDARKKPSGLEFPMFEAEPLDENEIRNYERKIKGITSPDVRKLIRDLQPYNAGADVADDLLLIVHNMDRFDKHRELAIVISTAFVTVPPDRPDLIRKIELYQQGKLPIVEQMEVSRALKNQGNVTPSVSFRQFGKRDSQPIIPSLVKLFNEVGTVVDLFGRFIKP